MKFATPIVRTDLTNLILGQLLTSGMPVGDATSPVGGGWNSSPNAPGAAYVGYVVLTPGAASLSSGPFGDSQTEWQFTYMLTSYGISREQTENQSDVMRGLVVKLARHSYTLGDSEWSVQQVRVNSIGGIARNDQLEPSEFSEADILSVWLSKEM